ncbi:MAG: universal stress protein [Bacteroidota bacterium]
MKKILVPVDFSEVSEAAAQFAVDLAKENHADVILLNSARIDYFSDYQYPTFIKTKSLIEEVLDSMEQRMNRLVEEFENKKINVSGKVSHLGLLGAIKEEIKKEEIDLCVMGTSGCSGLEELFIGSNTERVVRYVTCPVISIPHSVDIKKIKKLLIPIDLREIRASFLNKVAALQEMFDSEIEFIWVKTPHNIENSEKVAAELHRIFENHGIVNYNFFIVKSVFPTDGIFMEVDESGVDMVAMATHARRGISHWLSGSMTEDTINHVEVPVWSFKIDNSEKVLKLDSVFQTTGGEYGKMEPLGV